MELSNKILELRKKAGFSQEVLAEKLNVTRQTISNWELGQTTPDIRQVKELSKLFNISLDELVDNDLEVECKNNLNNLLFHLIGKTCYLGFEEGYYDSKIQYNTPVKVLNINEGFIKVEYMYFKKKMVKLIDSDLIYCIRVVEGGKE